MTSNRDLGLGSVLSIVSYGLAAVALTAGLVLTVAIVSAAEGVPDALTDMRGLGPLIRPFIDPIHTAVEIVAVVVFVLTVLASALLLALGGLLASVHRLARRVSHLESGGATTEPSQTLRPPGMDV
ncbi:MAG: hypothetical protein JXC32_10805 [Anaerolineae bacterium]|nr:hypothetical protein [Anaerolineae bacterium]